MVDWKKAASFSDFEAFASDSAGTVGDGAFVSSSLATMVSSSSLVPFFAIVAAWSWSDFVRWKRMGSLRLGNGLEIRMVNSL